MNITQTVAIQISELIQRKSQFQEKVGKLVLSVHSEHGKHQTDELSALIKEQGVTMSSSSLRQYAWVVKASDELNLPEDLSFDLKRKIISSPKKERYLKLIEKGYTSAQLKREMAIDNKESHTKCTGYCKICGKECDLKNHTCQ